MLLNIEIKGKPYKLDDITGELIELEHFTLPKGTKFITPEGQKQIDAYKEKQARLALKKQIYASEITELGHFYFIKCSESLFIDLKPQTATKLIYLCTCLYYEGRFMKTRKTPIYKKDLQKILRLSRSATYQFWQEVKDKYIYEDADGSLYINKDKNIFRGSLIDTLDNEYLHFQRLYIRSVKKLYDATPVKRHTQLGYVFKLLPYINLEYNIFCQDPFEQELNDIIPLTIKDFCKLVGYDATQSSRLMADLSSLTFDFNGSKEYLISYVSNGGDKSIKKIYVNPHILYNGTNYQKVEVLGSFCRAEQNLTRHLQDKQNLTKILQ